MRVLVIGATGYIGRVVAERLLAAGHAVLGMARSDAAVAALQAQGAEPLRGDLTSPGPLAKAAAACDAVVDASHVRELGAAGQAAAEAAYESLLTACRGKALVMTTGAGLLGDTGDRVADEATPPQPGWRAALEARVTGAPDVRGAVVRPGLVYGRGGSVVVSELLRVAAKLQAGWCVGSGENRWSAVAVDDLADLYLRVLEAGAGGIFHGAAGDVVMRELAQAIAEGYGHGRTRQLSVAEAVAETSYGPMLATNIRVSAARARALGWRPAGKPLADALRAGDYLTA